MARSFEKPYAGVREQRRNRQTGTLVSVVDDRDDTHMEDEDSEWFVCCEDHSSIATFTTRRDASRFMAFPAEFCEGCREIVGEES